MRTLVLAVIVTGCWTNGATTAQEPVAATADVVAPAPAVVATAPAPAPAPVKTPEHPKAILASPSTLNLVATPTIEAKSAATVSDRAFAAPAPRVLLGKAKMSPGLDPAIVNRILERNLHKIQACYDKQLQTTPGLGGSINANFAINANGVVTRASATGLTEVEDCVADVIKTLEFPKPDKTNVVVVYPFTFAPRGN